MFRCLTHRKDVIYLVMISALYLFLASYQIRYPLVTNSVFQIYSEGYRWISEIFKKDTYLMLSPHHGAMDKFLLLPFIKLFEDRVLVLRFGSIFYSLLGIIFTYSFVRELFGNRAAIVSSLLLAVFPSFVFSTSRSGFFIASPIMTFATMGTLFFLLKWYRTSNIFCFICGVFLIALGLGTRIWFLWLITSLIILKFVLRIPIIKTMRKAKIRFSVAKHIIFGCLAFLIGNFTMIYDNLTKNFITLGYLRERIIYADAGVDNLNVMQNFKTVIENLFYMLENPVGLFSVPFKSTETLQEYFKLIRFNSIIFICSFVWLFFIVFIKKQNKSPKVFLLLIFLFILAQTPFTCTNLASHHLLFLLPFICVMIAVALCDILKYAKGRVGSVIIIAIIVFLISGNLDNIRAYHDVLSRTGGIGDFSTEAYVDVVDWVEKHKQYEFTFVSHSHNMSSLIEFFTKGRISPDLLWDEDFSVEEEYSKGKDRVYIIPVASYGIIREKINVSGRAMIKIQTFFQRRGVPAFVSFLIGRKGSVKYFIRENFESENLDILTWAPNYSNSYSGWKIQRERIEGIETYVLDGRGGPSEELYNIDMRFKDFVLELDFRVIAGCVGFILRAQDIYYNLYMVQITSSSLVRWHKKIKGEYDESMITAIKMPFEIKINEWYCAKIVARGPTFKVYLKEMDVPSQEMKLAAEWTDPDFSFKSGYIGFRQWGSPGSQVYEHAQFDNIVIKPIEL